MAIVTLDQYPGFEAQIDDLSRRSWPEFLLHGDLRGWRALFTTFAAWQIVLHQEDGGSARVIAAGHTVPIRWTGEADDLPETISAILARAEDARAEASRAGGLPPTALVPVAAMVHPDFRGRGLSVTLIRAMLALADAHQLTSLVAPVRPPRKAEHPLVPMDEYLAWKRDDGLPFDPWIRVHVRLGAEILKIAPCTLAVEGSVEEWERWTGMSFPDTGRYIVPGALQPVAIDRERDAGRYEDPNVWMRHRIVPRRGPLPPPPGLR